MGGTASTTVSSGPSCDRVAAEIERRGAAILEFDAVQLMRRSARSAPCDLSHSSAGSTKALDRPSCAISGRQVRPPAAMVSRKSVAARRAEASRRFVVEGGEQQRLDQPLIERAGAADALAHGFAARPPQQPRQHQIVERPRVWHAAGVAEDPPRDHAVAELELPALVGREIDEIEIGGLRPAHLVGSADQRRGSRVPTCCPTG